MHCVRWLVRHSVARDELTVSQRTSSIDGSTTRPPLAHVAARFDRDEILDWICEEMSREQVAVDCGDHCSNTPVHVAARYGHLRCIQVFAINWKKLHRSLKHFLKFIQFCKNKSCNFFYFLANFFLLQVCVLIQNSSFKSTLYPMHFVLYKS